MKNVKVELNGKDIAILIIVTGISIKRVVKEIGKAQRKANKSKRRKGEW